MNLSICGLHRLMDNELFQSTIQPWKTINLCEKQVRSSKLIYFANKHTSPSEYLGQLKKSEILENKRSHVSSILRPLSATSPAHTSTASTKKQRFQCLTGHPSKPPSIKSSPKKSERKCQSFHCSGSPQSQRSGSSASQG